jgi:D-glucosaminate-6-phosphate ammonia-lyase
MQTIEPVINAAGKLTALGGSAQGDAVAAAQAQAAQQHVDLSRLRQIAGEQIAAYTGAEAACVTTGAAAGITISVASILTGTNVDRIQQLPFVEGDNRFLLQAGHAVNFGATVTQMIRLGGGLPHIVGSTNSVSERLLTDTIEQGVFAGMVYVQSHHCVQEHMVPLPRCIEICHRREIPVIVDAAAEEDLQHYVSLGVDLVTYSGGKAFGGPTVGFIAGKRALIEACEMQFAGIARPMKVGKEAIAGLLVALEAYTSADPEARRAELTRINELIVSGLGDCGSYRVFLKPDEADRPFERVAISAATSTFEVRDLVAFLAGGSPSIRTRNHHLDQGIVLLDPRELTSADAEVIVQRLKAFDRKQ